MNRLDYLTNLEGLTLLPDELRVYCALEKPDNVCISETWLCDEILRCWSVLYKGTIVYNKTDIVVVEE